MEDGLNVGDGEKEIQLNNATNDDGGGGFPFAGDMDFSALISSYNAARAGAGVTDTVAFDDTFPIGDLLDLPPITPITSASPPAPQASPRPAAGGQVDPTPPPGYHPISQPPPLPARGNPPSVPVGPSSSMPPGPSLSPTVGSSPGAPPGTDPPHQQDYVNVAEWNPSMAFVKGPPSDHYHTQVEVLDHPPREEAHYMCTFPRYILTYIQTAPPPRTHTQMAPPLVEPNTVTWTSMVDEGFTELADSYQNQQQDVALLDAPANPPMATGRRGRRGRPPKARQGS